LAREPATFARKPLKAPQATFSQVD